ncbi:DUF3369 domain-containing protein [Massilia sp. H-1]|nr:DUF3369 domain-containing protein [Massilia sp. H-1]
MLFIHTMEGRELCISVTPPWPLAVIQRDLLEVFCERIAAAFDNLYMFGQLRKAQEATVVALADLAEFHDHGTGGHVRRVQNLSSQIAERMAERHVQDPELTPQLLGNDRPGQHPARCRQGVDPGPGLALKRPPTRRKSGA